MNNPHRINLKAENIKLVKLLEESLGVSVYEDGLPNGLELDKYIIFNTRGFSPSDNKQTLSQRVYLRYASQNEDELELTMFDIIYLLEKKLKYHLIESEKGALVKGDTNEKLDILEFHFVRAVRYGF